MRYAFLLKKRTGLNISDNCLCRVSHEIARNKAAAAPTTTDMQPIELLLDEPSAPEAPAKPKNKPVAKRSARKSATA